MRHPARHATFLTGILLIAGLLAGCTGEEGEEVAVTTCDYVSIHYENELPREELRETFVAEGYEWFEQSADVAVVIPPETVRRDVRIVFANPSLSSGGGSVITVTETERSADYPGGDLLTSGLAQEVSALVNETLAAETVESQQWIQGTHLECPSADVTTVDEEVLAGIFRILEKYSKFA